MQFSRKLGVDRQIVANFGQAVITTARVSTSFAKTDESGRKYLPAGTPLGSTAGSFLLDTNSSVVLTQTTDSSTQAVLMHNQYLYGSDATASDIAASVVSAGVIVLRNAEDSVQQLYTADTFKALNKITFR